MDITQIATTIGFGVMLLGALWSLGYFMSFMSDGIHNWWFKRKWERASRPWTEKEIQRVRRNLVKQGTLTEEEAKEFK